MEKHHQMETNLTENLSDDLAERFGMTEELALPNNFYDYSEDETHESEEPDDVIILHMDIREPLRTLRKLLESKVGLNLKVYSFWLQDSQELEPHKNLVDQCVKGEGLVQINVQIQTTNQRINIIDVLKPTEAALAALTVEQEYNYKKKSLGGSAEVVEADSQFSGSEGDSKSQVGDTNGKARPCLNWVPDAKFKKDQIRLKIPEDPKLWTVPQVKHWFQWALRQFNLVGVSVTDWSITGEQLCSLTHQDFHKKMPHDPGNVFWTHLQLLKECKYVSVTSKRVESGQSKGKPESVSSNSSPVAKSQRELKIMRKSFKSEQKSPFQRGNIASFSGNSEISGNSSASGGQMQLWQFLLELLTDSDHTNVIQWVGSEGEFKLIDPEAVARLWGIRKNKPAMNYEKLSRALRYYYDGDMISKVCGKRFAYKFDCDLKLLIGYDAGELARLVSNKPYVTEAPYGEQIKDLQSEDE